MVDDELIRVPVFAALEVGRTIDVDGTELSTVVSDAADSPEVAGLGRVHAVEGGGWSDKPAIAYPVGRSSSTVLSSTP